MGEIKDYGPLLPTSAPEGTIEYCVAHSKQLQREYLIYRADYEQVINDSGDGYKTQKIVKAVCSHCGNTIYAQWIPGGGCSGAWQRAPFGFVHPDTHERLINGDHCLCPQCGAEAEVRHIGNISSHTNTIEMVDKCLTVMVCEGKPALLSWFVHRYIDKAGQSSYATSANEGCVVDGKAMYRVSGVRNYFCTFVYSKEWTQRKKWSDEAGDQPIVAPFDPNLLDGTELENAKLAEYIAACRDLPCYPISYARLYQKHPTVENLVQQGAGDILTEKIAEYRQDYRLSYYGYATQNERSNLPQLKGVDWKKKRPAQMLGLSKTEFELCKKEGWTNAMLEIYKALREAEPVDAERDMPLVAACGVKTAEVLLNATELRREVKVLRCLRYLQKQQSISTITVDGRYLHDYWKMCVDINENIDDPGVRFPKNLVTAHDRAQKELQEIRDRIALERKKAEIEQRAAGFAAMADKMAAFAWEQYGITIRACADEYELIAEGKALNHCVATYAGKVSRGETAIFLIRRGTEPEKPWYTLQLDPKKLEVKQNRGKCNCARTPEVEHFEQEWLEHIRSIRTKKNKKEKAA